MQKELSDLWDNVRELNRMDAVKEAALQQVPPLSRPLSILI
jgi:hypothetical protein